MRGLVPGLVVLRFVALECLELRREVFALGLQGLELSLKIFVFGAGMRGLAPGFVLFGCHVGEGFGSRRWAYHQSKKGGGLCLELSVLRRGAGCFARG